MFETVIQVDKKIKKITISGSYLTESGLTEVVVNFIDGSSEYYILESLSEIVFSGDI